MSEGLECAVEAAVVLLQPKLAIHSIECLGSLEATNAEVEYHRFRQSNGLRLGARQGNGLNSIPTVEALDGVVEGWVGACEC